MSKVELKNIKAYQTLPDIKSTDQQWLQWADGVVSKYGVNTGSKIILAAWKKRGSREANSHELRQVFGKKYGLEIDSSAWDKIVDVGAGVAGFASGVFKVGKWTLIIGVGVLAVVVIGTAYNAVKTGTSPLKAIKK